MPSVLDTHAWLWWVTKDRRLSRRARTTIERSAARGELEGLQVAELTRLIVVDSSRLPQPFRGDPADQIIAATARSLKATLITRDPRLQDYAHVRTLW